MKIQQISMSNNLRSDSLSHEPHKPEFKQNKTNTNSAHINFGSADKGIIKRLLDIVFRNKKAIDRKIIKEARIAKIIKSKDLTLLKTDKGVEVINIGIHTLK